MTIRRFGSLIVLGMLLVGQAARADGDPKKSFETLYGEEAKKVVANDAAAFAERLTRDAGKLKDDPALAAYLLDKAKEFLARSPAGAERARVGELLIDKLVDLGDARAKGEALADAQKAFQQAYQVASLVGSPKLKDLAARTKTIQERMETDKKVADLQAKLKAKPDDAATAKALVQLLVVEKDRPADAVPYLAACQDAWLQSNVPLAAGKVADVPLSECKSLAEWYRTLAARANAAGKAVVLNRAKVYYERFVANYGKQDASLLAAKKSVDDLQKELDKLAAPAGAAKAPAATSGTGGDLWVLQYANSGSQSGYRIIWDFRKDGNLVETELGNYMMTGGRRDISARTYDNRKKWAVQGKTMVVAAVTSPNSTWFETYTLAYPLQGDSIPVARESKSTHDHSTSKMTLSPLQGALVAEIAKHLGANSPKTKFPGVWVEVGRSFSSPPTWEFFDNGTAVRTYRYTYHNTGRPMSNEISMQAGKWEVKEKNLVIAMPSDDTTLALPLNKDGTKGRHVHIDSDSTSTNEFVLRLAQP